jgi:hypothetical protein
MATEKLGFEMTYVAGADLSGATNQYKFVKFNGTVGPTGQPEVILCAAVTDKPCGVLQEKPRLGEACKVIVYGKTKLRADAALTVGLYIGTSADGEADAKVIGGQAGTFAQAAEVIVGYVCEAAGAAGELCGAVINCATPVAAL